MSLNVLLRRKHRYVPDSYLELKCCSPAKYEVHSFRVSGSIKALLDGADKCTYDMYYKNLVGMPIVDYTGEVCGLIYSTDIDNDKWYGEIWNRED